MIWEDMNQNLIQLHVDAKTADDVFESLGLAFTQGGYTKDSYVDALKERERSFPTGLNINGFGIAIPHTEALHVLKEAEGIMTLKHPVRFIQMGSDDTPVDVKVVMMLAIENPQEHMKKLQQILKIVQDEKVLEKIYHASTKQEVIDLIKEKEDTLGGIQA